MLKEALIYLMEKMSLVDIKEVNGEVYSDRPLYRVNHNPKAAQIEMNTLSSLIEYIKSGFDDIGKVFVHIGSPTEVHVYSALDEDRVREHLVCAEAQVPSFRFNEYISHEEFCIALQSKFADSPDRALLLKFAGTVEAGSVQQYSDDGVTQKATIKVGVAGKQDALVPNPVSLSAFRTFVEVEQPCSQYIFRMKQGINGNVMCGLFEADGGAWKLDAMQNIKEYLTENLEGVENLAVIY